MRQADVERAASKLQADSGLLCWAISVVLPVLEQAEEDASGWKFWQKWGARAVVAAVRGYHDARCPKIKEEGGP